MKHIVKTILLVFLATICNAILFSQTDYTTPFSYLSPAPYSEMISPENTISFRLKETRDLYLVNELTLTVIGTKSGNISGKIHLADDGRTFIFTPNHYFSRGEQIEVVVTRSSTNNPFVFTYWFAISTIAKERQIEILGELSGHVATNHPPFERETVEDLNHLKVKNDSLPDQFPDISITDWTNPSEGYIFMAPFNNKKRQSFQYIIITDNFATPVFYSNIANGIGADFKLQPSNHLTYYSWDTWEFYKMNADYEIVDTINTGNGYTTDIHELIIQENGHSFLMAYDPQIVDMSKIVEGGNEEAVVVGLIIQELDESKNVVFQWRSWDHFEITDAANDISLITEMVDYCHGNAIEVDSDTSLLISSRNMHEITKINRLTGDIIWRLGGENNMFAFPDSSILFCKQHDIRVMPNSGNLSLFDNGNCHDPQYSSVAEYDIDLTNMTVELVQRMTSSTDTSLIYASFMGNAQRLENGNTITGWGSGIPSITEFDEEGNVLLQFSFGNLNYRAFKFDWETTVMSIDEELIDFGTIDLTDSAFQTIHLTNNYSTDISINRILNHHDIYSTHQNQAVDIAPGETAEFKIWFKPSEAGTFDDVFTFCWDVHTDSILQRISKQVQITGKAELSVFVNNYAEPDEINIFPNPVTNLLTISSVAGINQIRLLNSVGEQVMQRHFSNLKKVKLEFNLPSGLYVVEVISNGNNITRRKVIKY